MRAVAKLLFPLPNQGFPARFLGLSLSYDIVREHGGIIIPKSRHGDYTEMTVILPHTKKADADYDVGKTDS